VTSPPYYGLRDYGTAEWQGGDAECEHVRNGKNQSMWARDGSGLNGSKQDGAAVVAKYGYRGVCGDCGAVLIDQQLGLEKTPDEYVAKLVEVFREVKRVLRDDGTLWLNLGDSYANDTKWGGQTGGKHADGLHGETAIGRNRTSTGLPQKSLIGIPWRVAFALQADGWYLRQDIIWNKTNVMPEPVKDRCVKSHEYIFLLSKSARYYFDYEAIQEPVTCNRMRGPAEHPCNNTNGNSGLSRRAIAENRNRRSVWSVNVASFKGSHFATFPPKLIEPCIKAGCPEGGTVLDTFFGSGTTGYVADRLGCNCIGIELNQEYITLAKERTQQRSLFTA
jgi:DNA modification methylase